MGFGQPCCTQSEGKLGKACLLNGLYSVNAVRGFERDGRNSEEQCRKVFEDWLTTGDGCIPKTWQKLLQRIKRVDDLTSAADEIKEKLSDKH